MIDNSVFYNLVLIYIVIYLLFSGILPAFIISRITKNKSENIDTENKSQKIIMLMGYTFIFIVALNIFLSIYSLSIPDSTSGECASTGGFNYDCTINIPIGLSSLLLIFTAVIVYNHYFKKTIYEMFENGYKISKYIVLILFLFFMLFLNLVFIVYLKGIFVSHEFDIWILDAFRIIVEFSPVLIFPISVCKDFILERYISKYIKQNKNLN